MTEEEKRIAKNRRNLAGMVREDRDRASVRGRRMEVPKGAFFVPNITVYVLHEIVKARALPALPLVLAAHRRMFMLGKRRTPLRRAIWQAAGIYKSRDPLRRTMFTNLKKIPKVIEIEKCRSPVATYRLKYGPAWEEEANVFIEDENEDD
jgi:hypothetical protein